LAASTLIILFVEMLKNFPKNSKEQIFCEWKLRILLRDILYFFVVESSKFINYSIDMCWSWPCTMVLWYLVQVTNSSSKLKECFWIANKIQRCYKFVYSCLENGLPMIERSASTEEGNLTHW
jgi:hypothetical protein